MTDRSKWNIWRVTYATYAQQAIDGDIKPQLIKRELSFDAAKRLVDQLGFGYCMKPHEGKR